MPCIEKTQIESNYIRIRVPSGFVECDGVMDNLLKIKNLLKKDQQGLNIREISEKLNINRNFVAKLLDILTAKEEVEIRVHGRSKIYYLAKR